MPSVSKAKSVSVSKDGTKKMEDEARAMEAKLELLRRTLDVGPDSLKSTSGVEGGRWKSGSSSKPLTKGYVKGVLDTKVSRLSRGPQPPAAAGGAPAPGRNEDLASESRGRDGGASPATQPAREGKVGDLLLADSSPAAESRNGSRAAANLRNHVQAQSKESLEVEAFLAGLKLDRYVSLFMEQGFDCMETVREMQESHMRDLGMAPGHILKLQRRLAEDSGQGPAPSAPLPPPRAAPGATTRQVSFGGTEELQPRSAQADAPPPMRATGGANVSGGTSVGQDAGAGLLEGGFDEEASAASFQEALRAWRSGRGEAAASEGAPAPRSPAPAAPAAPAAPGSFWSSLGDCEVDLERASTPLRPPTESDAEVAAVQTSATASASGAMCASAGEEKLCCYQCYRQFFARFAVERSAPGETLTRKLCSETCAEAWVMAMQAKAEALRKRQEKLDRMEEMQRVLEAERAATPTALAGTTEEASSTLQAVA